MDTDDHNIARALQRQEQGLELSRHDRWCLKAYERRERRAQRQAELEDTGVSQAQLEAAVLNIIDSEFLPALEGLAEEAGASAGELQKRIRKLEAGSGEELLDRVARLLHGWMAQQAMENKSVRDALAELRSEMRMARSLDDDHQNIIDLPSWRRDSAARART
jgi:hypothetical protein